MAFSPDGKLLAASSADNSILLWDIAKHTPGSPLIGHRTAVTTIAFAPDGKQLASGAEDGTVIMWDVPAYQPLGQPLRSGMTATGAVAFSLDGNRLAASSGPNVMLWDVTLSDDRACNAAKRNLTVAEWQTYLGTEPYRQTCRTLPNYGR
jgi:WD40 repeat protein